MTPPQLLTFNILSKPRALPPSTNNTFSPRKPSRITSCGDCGAFVTMCSRAQLKEAYAVAAAAGPCVVEEIQSYDNWKAPAFFECACGVLLWGQLPTVMQGFLATDLDTPLGPQRVDPGDHSTILQHEFQYRAPARKGRWKVEAFFGGGTRPLGYVCHHADASGPELLRRAALVGVSLVNDHADRDIVYVNRYDWARWGCPAAGYHLMTELLKPERKPAEKMPKGTKPKPKGNKKKNQKKKPEEDYDEYKEGLVMNRFMLVDEHEFPQLAQSLREGFKLDTKNYRFKMGNAETDAFGVNLGVGGKDNELGWLAFQDGKLVGFVYDGVYCDLYGKFFRVGDTKVEVPREPTPPVSEHEFEEREGDEDYEDDKEYEE